MQNQNGSARCALDLEETPDGGVAATISASRYHLQWHACPDDMLDMMIRLLEVPSEAHQESKLGDAFNDAEVLLVVHETVVRLKVLRRSNDGRFSDLLEITLSQTETRSLLCAVRDAQELWGNP